jgi:tetratricopeptide (TPR) repeat protein
MMNLLEGSPQALDRAIDLLEKATTYDPNYASAWAALGAVYDLKGGALSLPDLSRKAVAMERRALAIDPKLADAHRWLGLSLLSLTQYDEAIAAMEEAARLEPGDANVYTALGRAYWIGKGDLNQGISYLERAAAINPDLGWAHLQLGLLYALRGDYEKAETACQHAVDMQERFISGREGLQILGAYTRLGYVYYLQGRYDDALAAYEREVSAIKVSDHALKERSLIELDHKIGATYLKMGRTEDADRHFAAAWKAFKGRLARGADDPFTKYYIAALSALRGEPDRALRYFAETLEQLPALNRARARVDPDFDPVRDHPQFKALLASEGETTTDSPNESTAGQPGVVS